MWCGILGIVFWGGDAHCTYAAKCSLFIKGQCASFFLIGKYQEIIFMHLIQINLTQMTVITYDKQNKLCTKPLSC